MVKNDPRIHFGQLENGFRYALMNNAYPKEHIVMALNFDVGSFMEEERECGLAHFLEHMAFRGSKHFPDGEIVQRMQDLGIAFGHDLNAQTSFHNTRYDLDLPHNTPETIQAAFTVFRDFCDGLSITQSTVDQERGVILSEKRDRNNVIKKLLRKNLEFFFAGTLIPKRLSIGKTSVIQNASAEDLRHFYEKWYAPEKMFLVAVGNLDVKQFEERIRQTFQDLPKRNSFPEINLGTLQLQERKFLYFSDPDLSTTTMEIATLFPDPFPDDSYQARRHLEIMNRTLRILQERLQDRRSENPSLFTESSTEMDKNILRTKHSLVGVNISCEYENWPACLTLLEQEIRKLYQYGVSEEELRRQEEIASDKAVKFLLAAPTFPSDAIARDLIEGHCSKTALLSPEDYHRLIETLNGDITPRDCWEEFRKIWRNIYVSSLSHRPVENAPQSIETVFEESQKKPILPTEEEKLIPFAYESFETPHGDIIKKEHVEDLAITQITLANGVRVNFKPTDFQRNQIQIALNIGHGLLTNYPMKGIFLLAQSFLEGGLGKNPWKQLRKLIRARGIQIAFNIDESGFNFTLSCDQKNLPFGLQLLTAYLSDPAFEERVTFETRERLKSMYRERSFSPYNIFCDAYQKFIKGNDIIAGLPDEESAFSVTMDEVKQLLIPVFQREAMELTLVGDFDLQRAIQNVQNTFGALPKRSPSVNDVAESGIFVFPKGTKEKIFPFTGDEKRTLSILTFLTDDENNIQNNRYLTVLAFAIGDQLYEKIRKEEGKIYSPIVDLNPTISKHFGLFEITLSLNPETANDTTQTVRTLIEEFKTTPLGTEELARIKLPILNRIRDNFRDNAFWLNHIKRAQQRPQDLENLRTMLPFYEEITSQNLLETARKYFNNPVHSIITPSSKFQENDR
ncbi:MAG: insulinase family protein [Puniceicoccales bacterium]|nr:insulinase family protein [Puniceicoccales bacterium]